MPLVYHPSFNTAATNSSSSRPTSSDSKHSQARVHPSRCSTPTESSSRHIDRSTTPPGSPFEGRLSPSETRQELIERKKREQRATWLDSRSAPRETSKVRDSTRLPSKSSPLLPSPEFEIGRETPEKCATHERFEIGSSIERPRSALHRGDFRQDADSNTLSGLQPGSPYPQTYSGQQPWLSTSPTTPWYQPRMPTVPSLAKHETFPGFETRREPNPLSQRQRAASYSARSLSFALQPPTSPLVQATNNSDSDGDYDRLGRPPSPDKASRRRTFSPGALRSMRAPPVSHGSSPMVARALPNVPRDLSFPYQAHQPRRSINSVSDAFSYSVPQSPSARSRRPSLASESSPLQRAPMVGRYEESILRGRMSSLPSRPLDFVAQIGVLGKGNCRSGLRCPPHVTIPFPAVFYNYGSRPGSPKKTEDGPSPYVGMIELSSLQSPADATHAKTKRRARNTQEGRELGRTPVDVETPVKNRNGASRTDRSRDSPSLAPVGGYRIPEKGQLQIVIKNPNKTAVKLFLIPYDLEGMQPGQKTFIRQRSYSAGPIIDMPVSARRNLGTDRPEAALTNSDDPKDRPTLRYLIHLNICCSAKGRYFLYKTMRVVFANRVPDGKERLRQEIQLPDPKFTAWKPEHDAAKTEQSPAKHPSPFSCDGNHNAMHAHGSHELDRMDGLVGSLGLGCRPQDARAFTFPVPHPVPNLTSAKSPPMGDLGGDVLMQTPPSPLSDHTCRAVSPREGVVSSPKRLTFERLHRDAYTENGSSGRPQSPRPGEGVLGLKLRDLAGSRPSSRGQ